MKPATLLFVVLSMGAVGCHSVESSSQSQASFMPSDGSGWGSGSEAPDAGADDASDGYWGLEDAGDGSGDGSGDDGYWGLEDAGSGSGSGDGDGDGEDCVEAWDACGSAVGDCCEGSSCMLLAIGGDGTTYYECVPDLEPEPFECGTDEQVCGDDTAEWCCEDSQECGTANSCGPDDCGNGTSCGAGTQCVSAPDGSIVCCANGTEAGPNGGCYPEGTDYCDGGATCAPGTYCDTNAAGELICRPTPIV